MRLCNGAAVSPDLTMIVPRIRPYFSLLSLWDWSVTLVPSGRSSFRYVLDTTPSGVLISGALIPKSLTGVLRMMMLNPRSMSSRMVSPSVTDMTFALYSYIVCFLIC